MSTVGAKYNHSDVKRPGHVHNFLQSKTEQKKETPYRMVRGFVIGLCWLFPPLLLALLHPGPVEKAIAIVDQEHDKADDHGQVRKVLCGG